MRMFVNFATGESSETIIKFVEEYDLKFILYFYNMNFNGPNNLRMTQGGALQFFRNIYKINILSRNISRDIPECVFMSFLLHCCIFFIFFIFFSLFSCFDENILRTCYCWWIAGIKWTCTYIVEKSFCIYFYFYFFRLQFLFIQISN